MMLKFLSCIISNYSSLVCAVLIYSSSLLFFCEAIITRSDHTTPLQQFHIGAYFNSLSRPSSHSSRQRTSLCGGGIIRGDNIPQLLKLIEASGKGLIKDNNDDIIKIFNSIGSKDSQFIDKDQSKVNGNWELLWTTEKETLFFIQYGLFGSAVSGIVQSIDFKNGDLNNLIAFKNGGEFSVRGKINVDETEGKRVNFKFTSASIQVPPFPKLSIPPVGKGWFDNVYVNDKYRLSKDIRGDYLVSARK